MKRKYLILPQFRPYICAECPLCGLIPKSEIEAGSKWTHICMMDLRKLSGRGTKTPTARNRCKNKDYEKVYFTTQGKFMMSVGIMEKYHIQETKLLFTPYEIQQQA